MFKLSSVIHLVILILTWLSIWNTYLDSYLIKNTNSVKLYGLNPSTCIIVIIVDGLGHLGWKNQKFREKSFLKHISRSHGISGIVKANAPTESRPRHIAIMSGFEEDIANLKSLWSRSVESFDSIVNQSTNVWNFGSLSVSDYFKKSCKKHINRVDWKQSPTDDEVFIEFATFLERYLAEFYADEKGKKLLFFNFASVDHADHKGGFTGSKYNQAINKVDNIINKMHTLLESLLTKKQFASTTFIVTGDHGVLSSGGHGGDSEEEILIPIFAWGAGIKNDNTINRALLPITYGNYPILLNQIDICPMLAALLGISIPTNSRGSIPVHMLSTSTEIKIKLVNTNIKHLTNLVKLTKQKNNANSFFPFLKVNTGQKEKNPSDLLTQPGNDKQLLEAIYLERSLQNELNFLRWFTWWTCYPVWVLTIIILTRTVTGDMSTMEKRDDVKNFTVIQIIKALIPYVIIIVLAIRTFFKYASIREMALSPLCSLIIHIYAKSKKNKYPNLLLHSTTSLKSMSNSVQARCILRWFLPTIGSFLTIIGFYQKYAFVGAILLLNSNIFFQKWPRNSFKFGTFIVTFLLAIHLCIIEKLRIQRNNPFTKNVYYSSTICFLLVFHVIGQLCKYRNDIKNSVNKPSVDTIFFSAYVINLNFMLWMSVFIFGSDLFSSIARKVCSQLWSEVHPSFLDCIFIFGVTTIIIGTYVYIVWSQNQYCNRLGFSTDKSFAKTWFIIFALSIFVGTFELKGEGSWANIGSSIGYLAFLTLFPIAFAVILEYL